MLKAVRKKRAYEDIVKQIRTLVEKGRLKRGTSFQPNGNYRKHSRSPGRP